MSSPGLAGEVATHLRRLADGLVSMRRPQSGVAWLRRSAIKRETLRDLAHGRIPCSHAALDAVGADRAVEYLRSVLVRVRCRPAIGALPTSNAAQARRHLKCRAPPATRTVPPLAAS